MQFYLKQWHVLRLVAGDRRDLPQDSAGEAKMRSRFPRGEEARAARAGRHLERRWGQLGLKGQMGQGLEGNEGGAMMDWSSALR